MLLELNTMEAAILRWFVLDFADKARDAYANSEAGSFVETVCEQIGDTLSAIADKMEMSSIEDTEEESED